MLKFLLTRPIGVCMTTLAVVIISLVFIGRIPVSLLPDIPIPTITVQISAPDLDARTLENTITRTLRNQLLQVNELEDIESRTRNGNALIELTLGYGVNTSLSFIEINEKIDQVMHLLPKNLDRPRVIKTNISDIPVFFLHMMAQDDEFGTSSMMELSEFGEKVIKRRLEQLDEIAFVDIHGLVFPEIIIRPDKAALSALNINEDVLGQALRDANVELGNVLIQDGAYQYSIRMSSRLVTLKDIESVYIRINERLFQLRDLADVRMEEEERRGSFFSDDQRAVVFSVRKKGSANNYVLRQSIDELLDSFRTDYPNLRFRLANDQSRVLISSISNLRTSLFYGLSFAGIILFLFFRDWRLPALIIVVVPVSLLITLLFFYLIGMSINIISLTGLILGVGLMIDNSIIIIENIQQKLKYADRETAAAEGANEVVRPLISSALTTSSVFLPLILLSGLAGALFYDQALSITIALLVSVAVSYFVLPVIAHIILKDPKVEATKSKDTLHSKFIGWIIAHRAWLLPLSLLFGASIILLFPKLEKRAFPEITRTDFIVTIDWNQQIDLEENERRARQFCRAFTDSLENTSQYLGELQFILEQSDQEINEAKYFLSFSGGSQEKVLSLISEWFDRTYPDASVHHRPVENVLDRIFNVGDAPVVISLQSTGSRSVPEYGEAKHLIEEVGSLMKEVELPPLDAYITLEILQDKLLIHRVSYQDVLLKLRSILRSNRITDLRSSDRFIPIQVSGRDTRNLDLLLVQNTVRTQDGQEIALSEFIGISLSQDYKNIEAGRSGEHLLIHSDRHFQGLEDEVRDRVAQMGTFTAQFSGSYYDNRRLIAEILKVSLVVIALLFLILAAQFESLLQPVIVAMTLPIGILGALLGLYICGETINVMALVGIIIMSGIDVNDAILKIDIINRNRRGGMDMVDAIIDGSERRIRPIIMTSLTTMLAMTPILFSSGLGAELQRPLAIAVIGGLLFGTVASVMMIPMSYVFLARRSNP